MRARPFLSILPLYLGDSCDEIPGLVAVQFSYRCNAVDIPHEVFGCAPRNVEKDG